MHSCSFFQPVITASHKRKNKAKREGKIDLMTFP